MKPTLPTRELAAEWFRDSDPTQHFDFNVGPGQTDIIRAYARNELMTREEAFAAIDWERVAFCFTPLATDEDDMQRVMVEGVASVRAAIGETDDEQ